MVAPADAVGVRERHARPERGHEVGRGRGDERGEAQDEDRQGVDFLATPREEPQDRGHTEPGGQDHDREDEGDAELARRAQVRVDPPEAAVAGRGGQRVEDEHLQGRERRDGRDDARDHRTRGEPHPAGPVGQGEGRRRRAGPGGAGGRGGATGGRGHAARLTARLRCGHESLRRRFVNESVCGGSAAVSSTTAAGEVSGRRRRRGSWPRPRWRPSRGSRRSARCGRA